MKKVLLLMLATGFSAATLFAQDQKTTAPTPEQKAEWDKKVKDELKLTDEQTVKYDALNKEYQGKFDALQNDASLDQAAQKDKKMALKKEKETKLMEILTPEQQVKYKDLIKQKKEAMEKKKDGKPGA